MSDCVTCENEPVSSGECPECGSIYHNDVTAPVPTFICVPNDWADETAGRIVRQGMDDSEGRLGDRIAGFLRAERERVTYLQGCADRAELAAIAAADRAEKAEAQVARVRALVAGLDAQDQAYPESLLDVRIYEVVEALRRAIDPDPGGEK